MKSKLLSEFSQFLPCGENKNRKIELLFEVIKSEREEVLEMLRCDGVVLSREGERKLLTHIEEKTLEEENITGGRHQNYCTCSRNFTSRH